MWIPNIAVGRTKPFQCDHTAMLGLDASFQKKFYAGITFYSRGYQHSKFGWSSRLCTGHAKQQTR